MIPSEIRWEKVIPREKTQRGWRVWADWERGGRMGISTPLLNPNRGWCPVIIFMGYEWNGDPGSPRKGGVRGMGQRLAKGCPPKTQDTQEGKKEKQGVQGRGGY